MSDSTRLGRALSKETVGGLLLLAAAALALSWANSPWGAGYLRLRDTAVGPSALHLHLSLGEWAADGLLAVFFFVAGLELKREFVAGELRDRRRAALPVVAAVAGMVLPALVYLGVVSLAGAGSAAARGWAIPTATDIAFALAVLAVVAGNLPTALRTFLLTLAVVDDLLAITIIAVFFTDHLSLLPLALAVPALLTFGVLVQRGVRHRAVLLPLAVTVWALVHASGIHATVAGVVLAFTVPARGGRESAEHFEHRFRPISAGLAVPVFAFFAAGVAVGGVAGLQSALTDPVALGVVLGLVVGKPVAIFATTYLVIRHTGATLDEGLAWTDILGAALLAGIGFTVSLLIGGLAFGSTEQGEHVTVAVLTGSLIAASLAAVLLRLRARAHAPGRVLPPNGADRNPPDS